MYKQNMVYKYKEISFSLKKDWNSDTCHNIDELWKHYAKWNKPGIQGQISYKVPRIGKFIETKFLDGRLVIPGAGRREDEELLFNGYIKNIILMYPFNGMAEKFWKWIAVMVAQH